MRHFSLRDLDVYGRTFFLTTRLIAALTSCFALQYLRPACSRSDIVAQASPGPGWGVQQYIFTAGDDSRAFLMTDTTVAVAPARHSLRINLPTGNPLVLPLPGQQLVKPATSGWCSPEWNCKAAVPGQAVVGASATLPPGKSFRLTVITPINLAFLLRLQLV